MELHDVYTGKLDIYQASRSYLSIEIMCWSNDGRYVAFSDSSKTVFVLSIGSYLYANESVTLDLVVRLLLKNMTSGYIRQMVFKDISDYLLVYAALWACIILILSASIVDSLKLIASDYKWIVYPSDPSCLIGFGKDSI